MKTRQRARNEHLGGVFAAAKPSYKATNTEVMSDLQQVLGFKPHAVKSAQIPPQSACAPTRHRKKTIKPVESLANTEYDAILGLASLMTEISPPPRPAPKPKQQAQQPKQSEVSKNPAPASYFPNYVNFLQTFPMFQYQGNLSYLSPGMPLPNPNIFSQTFNMFMGRYNHVPIAAPVNRNTNSRLPRDKIKRSAMHVAIAYLIHDTKARM